VRALKIAPYQVSRPGRRTKTVPGRISFPRADFSLEPVLTAVGSRNVDDELDDMLADTAAAAEESAR
jgi:hypothetical protein